MTYSARLIIHILLQKMQQTCSLLCFLYPIEAMVHINVTFFMVQHVLL